MRAWCAFALFSFAVWYALWFRPVGTSVTHEYVGSIWEGN